MIVSWNASDVIEGCIASVFEHGDVDLDVILVDNASGDGTVEAVAGAFPAVRIIETGGNLGFAPAANAGIRAAAGARVLLLNPEARLLPGALESLGLALDSHPSAGAAGPSLLGDDGVAHAYSARRFPTPWRALAREVGVRRLLERTGHGEALAQSASSAETIVPCLTGAALLVRREVFDAVGMLDEELPMYLEDLDLCARMGQAGLELIYVPRAVVVHEGAYSSSRSPRRDLLRAMEDGQAPWMYQRRFRGRTSAAAFAAAVGTGSLVRLAVLSPALVLAALVRRPSERLRVLSRRAWVLLCWALGSKSRFLAESRSAFVPPSTLSAGRGAR